MIYIWLSGLTAAVGYIIYNMHTMESTLDRGIPLMFERLKRLEDEK